MPYIDQTYYSDVYYGKMPKDPSDMPRLISRASDVIDNLTGGKAEKVMNLVDPVGAYSEIQSNVKRAVCAQVEHYVINGGYDKMQKTTPVNVRLGSFNYSENKNQRVDEELTKAYPDSVIQFLSQTGLLYNGVEIHD